MPHVRKLKQGLDDRGGSNFTLVRQNFCRHTGYIVQSTIMLGGLGHAPRKILENRYSENFEAFKDLVNHR